MGESLISGSPELGRNKGQEKPRVQAGWNLHLIAPGLHWVSEAQREGGWRCSSNPTSTKPRQPGQAAVVNRMQISMDQHTAIC